MGPDFSCLNPQQFTLKIVFFFLFHSKTSLCWGVPEPLGFRGQLGMAQGWAFEEQHCSLHATSFLCFPHKWECANYSGAQRWHFLARRFATFSSGSCQNSGRKGMRILRNQILLKHILAPSRKHFSTVSLSVSQFCFSSLPSSGFKVWVSKNFQSPVYISRWMEATEICCWFYSFITLGEFLLNKNYQLQHDVLERVQWLTVRMIRIFSTSPVRKDRENWACWRKQGSRDTSELNSVAKGGGQKRWGQTF